MNNLKILEKILDVKYVKNKVDVWKETVAGIAIDSRKVKEGFLFIAYKGTDLDGHQFIQNAIDAGAKFVVLEDASFVSEDVHCLLVDDARKLASEIASNFYDNPSSRLKVVGITGTNGKTTCAFLLHRLFTHLGFKSGLLSTIRNKYGDVDFPSSLTTPDAVTLQAMFAEMVEQSVTHVFMEVSSHALVQGRVDNVDFDIAVFTNITRDHLDYHKTFIEYINAKRILFNNLKANAYSLVNIDDVNGKVMVQNSKSNVATYALRKPADFKAKVISNSINGLHLILQEHEVFLKLIGHFNAYNALAVYGVASLLDLEPLEILTSLSGLIAVEGRMDVVFNPEKNVTGIIDYAHTPDALEKVLKTLNELKKNSGRIIVVVGCGGDRDKGKRPQMARIATNLSDLTVFTSDNPRSEIPSVIINEMMTGVDKNNESKVVKIEDRREAIKMAVMLSQKGDIVLIAGKGHEKYQEIKGQKLPFNDKEIFSAFLMH